MKRFTSAAISLVFAAVAACEANLAVTETPDRGSGGTAEGGESGGPPGASGGAAARTGSGGHGAEAPGGATVGGSAGSDAGGGGDAGQAGAGAAGGDPATGGAAGGPATGDCSNLVRDGDETDLDCGGEDCPACGTAAVCALAVDCESRVCRASRCQAPACDDKVQNGDELGVDCGGSCASGPRGLCAVVPTECACATSAALAPIACGVIRGPWDEQAYLDATGHTAALALCQGPTCDVHRWSFDDGLVSLAEAASVHGLSHDGSAVLVMTRLFMPFLWHSGDVRTPLPAETVYALSADGTTALVRAGVPARWTAAGGLEYLGRQGPYGPSVMTPDGAFVAGQRDLARPMGDSGLLLWNAAAEETSLGPMPMGGLHAVPQAISADGQVVVGTWTGAADAVHVYRWSAATGLVTLADSARESEATVIPPLLDADGSVLLSNYQPSANVASMAFRWTEASGITDFANSPPQGSVVKAASADASVAVGYTLESAAYPPFVWDLINGVRPLGSVLEDAGVDLEGWELGKPLALSADGKVMLGEGTCRGEPAVFRAVLP